MRQTISYQARLTDSLERPLVGRQFVVETNCNQRRQTLQKDSLRTSVTVTQGYSQVLWNARTLGANLSREVS